ncbi:uncharacterized protein EI97DRAFT_432801 [Westerdykella ornata]|uniref:Uncharacterized protein n=1 Tax=Westerdykella ornata TaxID=318751 RepID=A0A6A6JLT2_WESOR|nr:uncharacterized protein EI97DRAFT_432801 [Westerdykella ornata]KAF2277204.1 hypothetical protein EI97DRAFT_432801 [Westerdykella ornata]
MNAGVLPQIDFDLPKLPQEKNQYKSCSSVVASRSLEFGFNFTSDRAAENRWRFLDSSVPESHRSLRGQLTIDRGSFSQASDMEVHVTTRSSDENELENVHLHKSDSVLNFDYDFRAEKDVCTEVEIVVLFRPWPKRSLDWFDIRTSIFDINFEPSLGWEINNLRTHTSHGDVWMDSRFPSNDPLIAHNASISSIDGVIFGWYIPDENLELRSEDGGIGGFICPRLAEGVPFDPKSILMSTLSGRIRVGLIYEVWPAKVYTHRTKIESVSGDISAVVPHGTQTNISSISGSITTAIRPYGAASQNATSEIYTASRSGDSWVILYSPPNESLDGNYNPLLNTVSKHEVGEGTLWLDYPFAWWGEMEAKIEHGKLEFEGNLLEDIKREEGHVTATRGKKGASQMEAHVSTGALTVHLGLQELD